MVQCWSSQIDVREYLRKRFNDQEIAAILSPGQPKISQLLDLVRRAKGQAP